MSDNSNSDGDSDDVQRENIPDIDYGDLWEVKQEAGFDYDQQLAIESKCESLEVGDEVLINNRQRALTVVPREETDGVLLNMAFGETLFLKGNGTGYRLKWGSGAPTLDRGEFSDEEHVAFLRIESEPDDDEKQLITDGGFENPFPVEGTITPKENGYSASLPCVSEWLTETSNGDFLQRAVDRAARKYGNGTEVRVRFTSDRFGEECGDFELLGEVEDEQLVTDGGTNLNMREVIEVERDGEEIEVWNWVNVQQRAAVRGHNPVVEKFGADIGAGDLPDTPEAVTSNVAEELDWEFSIDVEEYDIEVIDPESDEVTVL